MNNCQQLEKTAQSAASDPRWFSVVTRDKSVDGAFYYSVRTTGVYCRPSCAARLARPENVEFYRTTAEAENAGYRPCKRCRPDGLSLHEGNSAKIAKACRLLEGSESALPLNRLANEVEMSSFHLHRIFRAATGLTPRGYWAAHRAKRVRMALIKNLSVTDAIYDAGFESSSRFYETSDKVLGMRPSNFRNGGTNTTICFGTGECSLGSVLVASSDRGICAVLLGDNPLSLPRDLKEQFPKARFIAGGHEYRNHIARVVGFIERPALGLDLPLDIQGKLCLSNSAKSSGHSLVVR